MIHLVMPAALSALAFMSPITTETLETAADSIEWAALSSLDKDCDAVKDAAICRVKRPYTAAELSEKVDAGKEVWREGRQLTFATRNSAEQMLLSGGVQLPMSKVVGTDLWVLTVRIPRIDEAFITWFFVPVSRNQDRTMAFKPKTWRGPKAFAAAEKYEDLEGHVYGESVSSRNLGSTRDLHIYMPPEFGADAITGVVYLGDGGAVVSLAKVVEPAILTGKLPRIMIVGILSDTARAPIDGRAAEYIRGYPDGAARWDRHEQFVITEVMPLVQRKFQAPSDARRVAVGGYSNSAAWAITMGLRHPEKFGNVIAFSPGGRKPAIPDGVDTAKLAGFYLLGGVLEPAFHEKAVAWAGLLEKSNARHILREPVAGHDMGMWEAYLVEALDWTFNRK